MSPDQLVISIGGWALILFFLYRFTAKRRHPSRGALEAFLIFLGMFGAIAFAAIVTVVAIVFVLGLEDRKLPNAVAGVLVIAVLMPAWRYALALIGRPAAKGQATGG